MREALHNLETHSSGERLPGLLESPGCLSTASSAFASAAAAAWDHLTNEDLLIVEGRARTAQHASRAWSGREASSSAWRSSTAGRVRASAEGTGAGRSASRLLTPWSYIVIY